MHLVHLFNQQDEYACALMQKSAEPDEGNNRRGQLILQSRNRLISL